MAISLKKSEKISLTKNDKGLEHVTVRLGWDANKKRGGHNYDLDASILMFGDENKLIKKVYYGSTGSKSSPILNSIYHTGDNTTGDGDGDDEIIDIQLDKIPSDVKVLDVIVNIYNARQRTQSFTDVHNAYVRVVDEDNREEFVKYNLSDNYDGLRAIHVAQLTRVGDTWEFKALGLGTSDNSIEDMIKNITRHGGTVEEEQPKNSSSESTGTEDTPKKKKRFGLF